MEALGIGLRQYVSDRVQDNSAKSWNGLAVILSDSLVPGEGEHKIMRHVLSTVVPGPSNPVRCIYGMDSDLILRCLAVHVPNLYVLRDRGVDDSADATGDAPEEDAARSATALDQQGLHRWSIVSIDQLRTAVAGCYSNVIADLWDSGGDVGARLADDFVLLTTLVGNDFLPRLPTAHIGEGALDTLMQIHSDVLVESGRFLTDRHANCIDHDTLRRLLEVYSDSVERTYVPRSVRRHATAKLAERHAANYRSLVCKAVELGRRNEALFFECCNVKAKELSTRNEMNLQPDLPGGLPGEAIDGWLEGYRGRFSEIGLACESYLAGLQWVQRYYWKDCTSWAWYYPFHYAPPVADLVDCVPQLAAGVDDSEPLPPLFSLVAVMPEPSSWLIPAELRAAVGSSADMQRFFPKAWREVRIDKLSSPVQGIVYLPFIDEEVLRSICSAVVGSQPCATKNAVLLHGRHSLAFSMHRLLGCRLGQLQYVIPRTHRAVPSCAPALSNLVPEEQAGSLVIPKATLPLIISAIVAFTLLRKR
eukprot:TRINITY_DN1145_c0_g2_i1.p1 TRINITY_DN1145_c0_g2~~TRINITY_DN1145_c0_g2_i1.p1  ORF type:complete len:533 (+),score=60.99 TRINITY_DN1145_c0_g2_i1:553-2151(+)